MKIFKTPKRLLFPSSDIAPDGRLLLAYRDIIFQWDNEKWSKIPIVSAPHFHRPLHIIAKYDNKPVNVNIELDGERQFLNLITGTILGYNQPLQLVSAPFGMVLVKFPSVDHDLINLYVAEWDWKNYNKSDTLMSFRHFGKVKVYSGFGFNSNPNRCLYASWINKPEAGILSIEDREIKNTKLEIPKSCRMLCGIPVNDTLSIGLMCKKADVTGKILRFYKNGIYDHDFILPFRAYRLHLSPEGLTLTAVGIQYIIQIDLEIS